MALGSSKAPMGTRVQATGGISVVAGVGAHARSIDGAVQAPAITTPAGRQLRPVRRSTAGRPAGSSTDRDRRGSWLPRYQRSLVVLDFVTAAASILSAYLIRFGAHFDHPMNLLTLLLMPLGWIALVAFNHGYNNRFVGVGAVEFQRIFQAFLHLTALDRLRLLRQPRGSGPWFRAGRAAGHPAGQPAQPVRAPASGCTGSARLAGR